MEIGIVLLIIILMHTVLIIINTGTVLYRAVPYHTHFCRFCTVPYRMVRYRTGTIPYHTGMVPNSTVPYGTIRFILTVIYSSKVVTVKKDIEDLKSMC